MLRSGLLALFLMISLPALADGRVLLNTFAADLETLSADFRQLIFDQDGFLLEESHGSLHFQRPDRFRWDYLEPFPQLMVADGERLWHFDEALDQVTVRDQPEAADSPMLVLTRPELLERFYQIEPGGDPDELRFTPLDAQASFEWASLRFVEGLPVELRLLDRLVGQLTVVELEALQRNPALSQSLFQFEPPPGVDVLEGYGD